VLGKEEKEEHSKISEERTSGQAKKKEKRPFATILGSGEDTLGVQSVARPKEDWGSRVRRKTEAGGKESIHCRLKASLSGSAEIVL